MEDRNDDSNQMQDEMDKIELNPSNSFASPLRK